MVFFLSCLSKLLLYADIRRNHTGLKKDERPPQVSKTCGVFWKLTLSPQILTFDLIIKKGHQKWCPFCKPINFNQLNRYN